MSTIWEYFCLVGSIWLFFYKNLGYFRPCLIKAVTLCLYVKSLKKLLVDFLLALHIFSTASRLPELLFHEILHPASWPIFQFKKKHVFVWWFDLAARKHIITFLDEAFRPLHSKASTSFILSLNKVLHAGQSSQPLHTKHSHQKALLQEAVWFSFQQ